MNKKVLLIGGAMLAIALVSGYVGYLLGSQNLEIAKRAVRIGPPIKAKPEQVMEAISDYLNTSEARFHLEDCAAFEGEGYKLVRGGKYVGVFDSAELKMVGVCHEL